MRYLLRSITVLCFIIALAGCTPDSQQPQNADAQPSPNSVARRASKKKAMTEKAAVSEAAAEKQPQQEKAPYSYTSAGKPDPFNPLIADPSIKLKAGAPESRNKEFLTPLQKYELKDLKLVAVVVSEREPTAMLEDPTGYGYVVRKDTLVGPNDGIVVRVIPTGLIIKEKIYNSLGEVETKISTLTIQHVE